MAAARTDNHPVDAPEVSVVITVYNYGKYLAEAIQSVAEQTLAAWEMIVVDDNSADNSIDIAEAYQKKLPGRITLIKNKKNVGVSRSRNIGFSVSRGQYIAFLDADDRWHPAKLELQLKALKSSKGVHLVHTGVEPFASPDVIAWLKDSDSKVKHLDHWEACWNEPFVQELQRASGYFSILSYRNPICLSSVLITRDAFTFLEGFDEGLFYQVEDWLLWLKCSIFFSIKFIPQRLTYYRIHQSGYTSKVFIRPAYRHDVAQGQVRDRCVAFARRKQKKLSYQDFAAPPQRIHAVRTYQNLFKKIGWRTLINLRDAYRFTRQLLRSSSSPAKNALAKSLDLDLLILFVTSACNLSCSACFYRNSLHADNDMTFDQIRSIAETSKPIKQVLITGGEPFLRSDIEDIVQLFIDQCDVGINTNGYFPLRIKETLTRVLSKYRRGRLTVSVSIDGFENTHNTMRGHGHVFEKALDTLRVLLALKKKHRRMSVVINTLISDANLNELIDFASEIALGFPIDYHNFEIERSNPETTQKLLARSRQLGQFYKDLLGLIARNYPAQYRIDRARFKIQYDNLIQQKPWDFPCLAGQKAVTIYPSGRLTACEMRPSCVDLKDYGYRLEPALTSKVMQQEVDRIEKDKCFCTHGCWVLVSMPDDLRNYL